MGYNQVSQECFDFSDRFPNLINLTLVNCEFGRRYKNLKLSGLELVNLTVENTDFMVLKISASELTCLTLM